MGLLFSSYPVYVARSVNYGYRASSEGIVNTQILLFCLILDYLKLYLVKIYVKKGGWNDE